MRAKIWINAGVKAGLALLLAGFQPGSARAVPAPHHGGHYLVSLVLSDFAGQMQALRARRLDIAGVDLKTRTVDLILDREELSSLSGRGFRVLSSRRIEGRAPDPRYKTPERLEAILRGYADRYPRLARFVSIGKSLEGRDIWALRITRDPSDRASSKPAAIFNGMHHAREVMSDEVPLDIVEYLLTRYGSDSRVTRWVDSDEIWVVPMLNVDGNNRVWTEDNMWRKNTRAPYGVDINRNYPFAWGSCRGSSGNEAAEDYRGPSAASEPETRVMMDLVRRVRPVFDISFHSYSELVIYPYGCSGHHTPSRGAVERLGQEMAALIPRDDGDGHYAAGASWEVLYSTDGDDVSWMYHEMNVIPYLIELNGRAAGFQPSYAEYREPTVEKLRPAWQLLLDRLDGPGIRGYVLDPRSSAVDGARVTLRRSGAPAPAESSESHRVNPDGSFQFVVDPGSYSLTIEAPGHPPRTENVVVRDKRADLNIALRQ